MHRRRFCMHMVTHILLTASLGFFCTFSASGHQFVGGTMDGNYYSREWRKVDSALAKSLPKSALAIVEKIYAHAKADNDSRQIIRSVTYRVALRAETSDEGEVILVRDIAAEIADARQPVRAVMQSILAELFWRYYEEHRWEIRDRTVTADTPAEDFRTWDARAFFDTTAALYLASIAPERELAAMPTAEYREILLPGPETVALRPTLFDILAHRALAFFASEESNLPQPVRAFELASLDALRPADEFCAVFFQTPDENDALYRAVRLYQGIEARLLAAKDVDALVDADLMRLSFMRAKTLHEDRDTAYYKALENLYAKYSPAPASVRALAAMAQYRFDRGDYIDAMALCEKGAAQQPRSGGGMDCAALRDRILEKGLSLSLEETVPPDAPVLAVTGFRNIPTVWYRIYTIDESWEKWFDNYDDRQARLRTLLRGRPVKEWRQELPAAADYKDHRTDVACPAMPAGRYLLLASPREDFALDHSAVAYARLTATRLSMQTEVRANGDIVYRVHDAASGEPIAGAVVTLVTNRYDYRTSQYHRDVVATLTTGADGSALFPARAGREAVTATVAYSGETLNVSGPMYSYDREPDSSVHNRSMLFTDRSLYRPGQTIRFKGIVMRQDNGRPSYQAAPKLPVHVEFFDANYRKIAELDVVTNEFGSYTGAFTAPAGVLTGRMTIRDPWGNAVVRVEEYKRPKFEVAFQPVKGAFSLGDTIHATATAKAYAGSNIDDARVSYRVVRQARYPYWRWWWMPTPAAPAKEIAHGTLVTNERGEFTIDFTAVPDRSIARVDLPVFTYTVTADVTDVNGETHSGETGIAIGYTSVTLALDAPEIIERRNAANAVITARNLNGEPLRVRGAVTFELLRGPDRVMRVRTLPKSDLFAMDRNAYIAAFPFDVYDEEDRREKWPAASVLRLPDFATDAGGRDTLALAGLVPGTYRLSIAARDDKGNDLRVTRYVTVYDRASEEPVAAAPAVFMPVKTVCEPGEAAVLRWGTSYRGARVLYQVERRGTILHEEWITLDDAMREFTIPIDESCRGGVTAHFGMVRNYRWYDNTVAIAVPWTNKELHIETATFRDKLLPGQDEEWRLTIRGSRRDAVAAEIVASMYDASLDAIYRGAWPSFAWPSYYGLIQSAAHTFGISAGRLEEEDWNPRSVYSHRDYPELNLFLLGNRTYGTTGRGGMGIQREMMMSKAVMPEAAAPGVARDAANDMALSAGPAEKKSEAAGDAGRAAEPAGGEPGLGAVKARSNFNETAFFFPQLATNDAGEVVLKFTMPEALTRWRFTAFAHTKGMETGSLEKTAVTQKDLMVMPNAPRFLREGDRIVFPVKISNMTDGALRGTARLALFDAVTMEPVDARFGLADADTPFTAGGGLSTSVSWSLTVPAGITAVTYRVVAKAGAVSDGEEAPLPVLPNRMLVTETLPLNVRGNETRSYTFEKLVASGASSTLRSRRLTLEMTSNPAWYAVQALPYLMEFPYECSEQVFNRFYANSIAAHLVNSSPKIRRVFEQWKNTDALVSNLEKNQELKSLLLQETPWVMDARDEGERKKRIALLFDLNAMSTSLTAALQKLQKAQGGNGGWSWFTGMPESRYITQYILAGFGHLRALGVPLVDDATKSMIEHAVEYADREMNSDYQEMKRRPHFNPKADNLGYADIQYLYARSFFDEIPRAKECDEAAEYWRTQAARYWTGRTLMSQGMIALALHRLGDKAAPRSIVRSLDERALRSDEMGMYWKQDGGWFWYQAPIETQALLVEVFDEVAGNMHAVEEMKIWLLKQKQVQDWKTTIATAEACYALLRRGSDLLASDRLVEVALGGEPVDPRGRDAAQVEAGTGYYTVAWEGAEVRPEMGRVTVTKRDSGIAWGALYWQYFEQLDRITFAHSPLRIDKRIFRQGASDKGPVLEPITERDPLHVGDLVKVRIEIRCDRDMEYIHLKDMRGAGFELVNQLSAYRWQGGLGYYEAPKDAAVNFFISWLPKGVHVFEYALRVSHEGVFSNGISTIQSMYAPEFAGHTAGMTVRVNGEQ